MQEVTKVLKTPKVVLKTIPLEQLKGGQYQPRQSFPEEGLKSLAETIKRVGVLEPLLVRSISDSQYEIIAGERRWRAAQMADLSAVPCLVGYYNDEQASHIALIENINRENLNPIDEAMGINRVIMEFDYTHEEAGAILGLPRSHITNLLRLLKLDTRVQDLLRIGELSVAHGKILAGVAFEKQHFFANQCIEKQWSMRALSQVLKESLNKPKENTVQHDKKDIDIFRLEQEVSDQLGHEVKFCLEKNKSGYINIRFANLDEFEVILSKVRKTS